MTEEDRISYLNFCCGLMMGTLWALRNDLMPQQARIARIDECMEKVEPLLEKTYEFQAKQENVAARDRTGEQPLDVVGQQRPAHRSRR